MRGRTNIADTLKTVCDDMFTAANGDRSDIPNILVLLTDGQPTVNADRTIPEAIKCRIAGVTIISVTIEIAADNIMLQSLTSVPIATNHLNVPRFDAIGTLTKNVTSAMCNGTYFSPALETCFLSYTILCL